MYEKLVNLLRRCGKQKCKDCEYEYVIGCVTKLNEEAADAIEELQKKYDGAVSDNKSLCRQIAELAKERNEAYSKGLLEGGIAQRAEDEKWMPKWIPVTERLPEKDTRVIVCASLPEGVHSDFIYEDGHWFVSIGVTHWMPFPEPPKEGE